MFSYDIFAKRWKRESWSPLVPGDEGVLGPRFKFSASYYPRSRSYSVTDYDPVTNCIMMFGGVYYDYREGIHT